MDYSNTLSTSARGGAARLSEILRQILLMETFKVEPLPEGGFRARRPRCRKNDHHLFMISSLTVTPLGRDLLVEADFGGARWFRNFFLLFFPAFAAFMFFIISLDTKSQGKSDRFLPLLFILALTLMGPLLAPLMRRNARRALDRLLQAAAAIADIP